MPEQFTIFRRSEKMIGQPPIKAINIERSTSDTIPYGAVSLDDLRTAEIARAEEAQRLQTESGAFGIFIGEKACVALTDIGSLTRGLGPDAVVYEPVSQPDQPNDGALAHFART